MLECLLKQRQLVKRLADALLFATPKHSDCGTDPAYNKTHQEQLHDRHSSKDSSNDCADCGIVNSLSRLGQHLSGDRVAVENTAAIFDVRFSISCGVGDYGRCDRTDARAAHYLNQVSLQRASGCVHVAGRERIGFVGLSKRCLRVLQRLSFRSARCFWC